MTAVPVKFRWKLFISFILSLIALNAIAIIFGFIPWDPVGILVAYGFIGFLIFIGYLIDYLGLSKYMIGYKK